MHYNIETAKEMLTTSSGAMRRILPPETVKYCYIENEKWIELAEKDIIEAEFVYWSEIFQRVHFIVSSNLYRTLDWLAGIQFSLSSENPILLCSSLRGLIESAADFHYTIKIVPGNIKRVSTKIRKTLRKDKQFEIVRVNGLEERLIHYIMGSKKYRKGNFDQSYVALEPHQYIRDFEIDIPDIGKTYAELCEFVHPAEGSTDIYIKTIGDTISLGRSRCRAIIEELLVFCGFQISEILRIILLDSVFIFGMLNELGVADYINLEVTEKMLRNYLKWDEFKMGF